MTGSSSADTILIGCVDPSGGSAYGVYVCLDGNYNWVADGCALTATSGTLNIYAGSGNDEIGFVTGDNVNSFCGSEYKLWDELTNYGIYEVQILGEGGADTIQSGDCAGCDIDIDGGSGNDNIWQYSPDGGAWIRGNSGNDGLLGASGSTDDLRGDAGDDCLEDLNDVAEQFDCGSGSEVTGDYYVDPGTEDANCEHTSFGCFP